MCKTVISHPAQHQGEFRLLGFQTLGRSEENPVAAPLKHFTARTDEPSAQRQHHPKDKRGFETNRCDVHGGA